MLENDYLDSEESFINTDGVFTESDNSFVDSDITIGGNEKITIDEILGGSLFENLMHNIKGGNKQMKDY
jgi:hypothetical protein